MKLRYSPRATWDLAEIADYLTARSPEGALSVDRRIRKTIDLIAAFPVGAGRSTSNLHLEGVEKIKYRLRVLVTYEHLQGADC